ncbi:MAG: AgmX/PglI C-terminal domain-containing protein [Polyangiaceae bacterium]
MRRALVATALFVAACSKPVSTTPNGDSSASASASASVTASASASASSSSDTGSAPRADGLGPLPSSEAVDARKAAVLDFLAGGDGLGALPELATPDGAVFDPQLRDKVAPLTTAPQRMRLGAETVSAGLPPEVVRRIVRSAFARFRKCYEDQLTSQPDLAGKVVVAFEVGKGGKVINAKDGGSDAALISVGACAVRVMRALDFPEPEGNVVVRITFPFTFQPNG